VSRMFAAGWCGVDLFFVLSGYLITRILCDAKGSDGYFRNFYIRRILRIFPIYYGLLLFTFVIIPNLPAGLVPAEKLERWAQVEADPLWFWFYLSNFAIASGVISWGHGTLDVTWSLAIEEQFYLLWPSVVFNLSRERLRKICVGIFVAAFLVRVIMTLGGMNPIATYVFTAARFDVIAAGIFVALTTMGPGALRPARRIWVATSVALLGLFLWRGTSNFDPIVQTLGLSLVALNFAALLATVLSLPPTHWLVRLFSMRSLRSLGKYSYAMYLVHVPLAAVVRDTMYGPNELLSLFGSKVPGQMIFLVLAISLIFAVAFVSWHTCEKQFLRLKPTIVSRAERPAYASV